MKGGPQFAGCLVTFFDNSRVPAAKPARVKLHRYSATGWVSTNGLAARKASPGSRDRNQPINTQITMLISASAAKLLRTPPIE